MRRESWSYDQGCGESEEPVGGGDGEESVGDGQAREKEEMVQRRLIELGRGIIKVTRDALVRSTG